MNALNHKNKNRHHQENSENGSFFGTLKDKMSNDKNELSMFRKNLIDKKNYGTQKMKNLEDE